MMSSKDSTGNEKETNEESSLNKENTNLLQVRASERLSLQDIPAYLKELGFEEPKEKHYTKEDLEVQKYMKNLPLGLSSESDSDNSSVSSLDEPDVKSHIKGKKGFCECSSCTKAKIKKSYFQSFSTTMPNEFVSSSKEPEGKHYSKMDLEFQKYLRKVFSESSSSELEPEGKHYSKVELEFQKFLREILSESSPSSSESDSDNSSVSSLDESKIKKLSTTTSNEFGPSSVDPTSVEFQMFVRMALMKLFPLESDSDNSSVSSSDESDAKSDIEEKEVSRECPDCTFEKCKKLYFQSFSTKASNLFGHSSEGIDEVDKTEVCHHGEESVDVSSSSNDGDKV